MSSPPVSHDELDHIVEALIEEVVRIIFGRDQILNLRLKKLEDKMEKLVEERKRQRE